MFKTVLKNQLYVNINLNAIFMIHSKKHFVFVSKSVFVNFCVEFNTYLSVNLILYYLNILN